MVRVWETPSGLLGALTTVDHKEIGKRHVATGFTFFVIGGIRALLMRTQLARPENTLLDPEAYNQLFSMHGTTMDLPLRDADPLRLRQLLRAADARRARYGLPTPERVLILGLPARRPLPLLELPPRPGARRRLVRLRPADRPDLLAGPEPGPYLLAFAVLLFVANFVASLARGAPAGADPWGGSTLEWATSSPPPPYNFRVLPVVHSRDPLWDEGGVTLDPLERVEARAAAIRRENLGTTIHDAQPDEILALALAGLLVGVLLGSWALTLLGGLVAPVAIAGWLWPTPEELAAETVGEVLTAGTARARCRRRCRASCRSRSSASAPPAGGGWSCSSRPRRPSSPACSPATFTCAPARRSGRRAGSRSRS
jgi:hypothetical protein